VENKATFVETVLYQELLLQFVKRDLQIEDLIEEERDQSLNLTQKATQDQEAEVKVTKRNQRKAKNHLVEVNHQVADLNQIQRIQNLNPNQEVHQVNPKVPLNLRVKVEIKKRVRAITNERI
jgi:hypothetical protein